MLPLIPQKNLFGLIEQIEGAPLSKRFVVPPFSIMDAKQGPWQDRKREWIQLGIKGEEGRQDTAGANNICSEEWGRGQKSEFYEENDARCDGHGLSESQSRLDGFKKKVDAVPGGGGPRSARRLAPKDAGRVFGQDIVKGENKNFSADYATQHNDEVTDSQQKALGVYNAPGGAVQERAGGGTAGTSVFDPVLCECVYRWFAPPGGHVLDPFAGESTKGIVATYLGYQYTAMELRPEQIAANNKQAATVRKQLEDWHTQGFNWVPQPVQVSPNWIQGDSVQLDNTLPFGEEYDLIFTSPPYYDLEIYSASEKDGSAFETYEKFMAWYEEIFRQAVSRLKDNRFLVVKVGEVRDEKGELRNFVGDNVSIFKRLGLRFYNDIILYTAIGSLPVRIGAQFPKYRKIGRTHQYVLVFWKGSNNFKNIPAELGVLAKDEFTE